MIVVHFGAFMFLPAAGAAGIVSLVLGTSALAWAGILFMWASVPYRGRVSSRWMLAALIAGNTFYIVVLCLAPASDWLLKPAAILMGTLPLVVSLGSIRALSHPFAGRSSFLLRAFRLPPDSRESARRRPCSGHERGPLHRVLGCCIHFWYAYRRATQERSLPSWDFLSGPMSLRRASRAHVLPPHPFGERGVESASTLSP